MNTNKTRAKQEILTRYKITRKTDMNLLGINVVTRKLNKFVQSAYFLGAKHRRWRNSVSFEPLTCQYGDRGNRPSGIASESLVFQRKRCWMSGNL